MDPKDIAALLGRQRRLILATMALVFALAFLHLLTATPVYRASTLLLVDGRGSNLLDPSSGETPQGAVLNARVDGEVEILRSDATALAVIEAAGLIRDPEFGPRLGWIEKAGIALGLDLSPDGLRGLVGLAPRGPRDGAELVGAAMARLGEAVTIRRQDQTWLIAISVASVSPQSAARIANAYAATYIRRQVEAKTQALLGARDVLSAQIATARSQLAQAEAGVEDFIAANLARLEAESSDPAIVRLRQDLEATRTRRAEDAARLAAAAGAQAEGAWDEMARTLGDAALEELARQRSDLARRLAGVADGSAEAVDLARGLAQIEDDLALRADSALAAVRSGMDDLDLRATAADARLREALVRSGLPADLLAELFELQQAATIARSQYQTLLARAQDMGTLANIQIADARVVSEALPPDTPASPNRRLGIVLGLAGGLALGIVLAFLREYHVGGAMSASQLRNVLQARVPVSVPRVTPPEGGSPADLVALAPMSPYAETFRKLRAAIDTGLGRQGDRAWPDGAGTDTDTGRETGGSGRVIIACSALPAEGKTSCALALARTYALAGMRTLLVDADLRKPGIARRIGASSTTGLLDYLLHQGALGAATLETAEDPLSPLAVLTAGERSTVPTGQLIDSRAFHGLLGAAVRSFDIVVLDSPPLLPVVDARYLARHADAAVLVVRQGLATQGELREALGQLHEAMRPGAFLCGILSHEDRTGRRQGRHGGGYFGDGS